MSSIKMHKVITFSERYFHETKVDFSNVHVRGRPRRHGSGLLIEKIAFDRLGKGGDHPYRYPMQPSM